MMEIHSILLRSSQGKEIDMLGIQVTKLNIMSACGDAALIIKREYEKCVSINEFLIRTPNSDLLALGFTQPEIDVIKSAMADLAFQKSSAFDSSSFVKQLYGMGI